MHAAQCMLGPTWPDPLQLPGPQPPLPRSHAAALIGRGPLEGAPLWNP